LHSCVCYIAKTMHNTRHFASLYRSSPHRLRFPRHCPFPLGDAHVPLDAISLQRLFLSAPPSALLPPTSPETDLPSTSAELARLARLRGPPLTASSHHSSVSLTKPEADDEDMLSRLPVAGLPNCVFALVRSLWPFWPWLTRRLPI
jgi:hypothetical protein